MAAKSKDKQQRRQQLFEKKARRRENKKKRQTRIIVAIFSVLVAALLLLSLFLCGRALLRSFREKEKSKLPAKVDELLQADSEALEGYWWYDESSFFCIQDGEYRSYYLNDDGSAFLLSNEYTVSVVGKNLLLSPKEEGASSITIRYTLEEGGKRLHLNYTNAGGESYIPDFTAGDPPTLPLLDNRSGS